MKIFGFQISINQKLNQQENNNGNKIARSVFPTHQLINVRNSILETKNKLTTMKLYYFNTLFSTK